MNEIIINVLCCLLAVIVFVPAILFGIFKAIDHFGDKYSEYDDMYCFGCEIEMPVKVKNGRLYCKNCGLYHGKL